MILRQIVFIVALSSILGIATNLISPNRISFFGKYRSLSGGDGPIVPPSAEAGDPAFIAVDVAEMEFSNYDVTFIDARTPEEFECGTIAGSVNVPFDNLPEEDLRSYIDSVLGGTARNHHLIIFCSGEECEVSLHLARNMQALGYTNLSIFYGGYREWENFGLPIERRVRCGE